MNDFDYYKHILALNTVKIKECHCLAVQHCTYARIKQQKRETTRKDVLRDRPPTANPQANKHTTEKNQIFTRMSLKNIPLIVGEKDENLFSGRTRT